MGNPIHYVGRETEEWWWGGKSNQYQHIKEHNTDDEVVCKDYSSDYKTRLEAEEAAIIKSCELL